MSQKLAENLAKIPVINWLVLLGKKIILPGFEGMSLYDLVETYILGIVKGTFSARVGAISFSFFMALFPFLLFLLNLIPYVPIVIPSVTLQDFQQEFLVFISDALPSQTSIFISQVFNDIAGNPRGGLLSSVFVLSLFLMTNGINAVFSGFEHSYHNTINRNFFRQYIVALGVSIIVALLLIVTVIVTIYFSYLVNKYAAGVIDDTVFWITIGKYAFLVLMVFLTVSTLFYFDTTEGKESKYFSPEAFMTTLLSLLATYLFGIYIDNFSQYNQLYGSIGALLIMMLYIWLNANLLLLGFELNASLNKFKKN